MTEAQVQALTAREGAVQRGKPLYADRSWTQVHDEMIDGDARTVGASSRSNQGATRRDESAGGQPKGRLAWFVGWLWLAGGEREWKREISWLP